MPIFVDDKYIRLMIEAELIRGCDPCARRKQSRRADRDGSIPDSSPDHPRHVQRSIAANREHIGLVVETELIGASDSGRADRPELLSVIKVDLPSRRSVAHYNGVLSAVGHGIHRGKTQTDGSGGRPDVDCPHAGLPRGWVVCATRH